eukprot:GHVN01063783.1.p1 GENE.GHVN01063783.1~~GHVN01063783.1.p1  ORF type:complete len:547 (+),score=137.80 GHVN01063783.1:240-1643(+)
MRSPHSPDIRRANSPPHCRSISPMLALEKAVDIPTPPASFTTSPLTHPMQDSGIGDMPSITTLNSMSSTTGPNLMNMCTGTTVTSLHPPSINGACASPTPSPTSLNLGSLTHSLMHSAEPMYSFERISHIHSAASPRRQLSQSPQTSLTRVEMGHASGQRWLTADSTPSVVWQQDVERGVEVRDVVVARKGDSSTSNEMNERRGEDTLPHTPRDVMTVGVADLPLNSSSVGKRSPRADGFLDKLIRELMIVNKVKSDHQIQEVVPRIYIGSVGGAHTRSTLEDNEITHILKVGPPDPAAFPDDFTCLTVELKDNKASDLLAVLPGCFKFIDGALDIPSGRILVHCWAGVSRSVAVVAAYLIKTNAITVNEALQMVKNVRPVANPNAGFVRQLNHFYAELRKSWASSYSSTTEASFDRVDALDRAKGSHALKFNNLNRRVNKSDGQQQQHAQAHNLIKLEPICIHQVE